MGKKCSLPYSQQAATATYHEPDESSPQPSTSVRSILKLYLHQRLPSGFPTKTLYAFLSCVLHGPYISASFIRPY